MALCKRWIEARLRPLIALALLCLPAWNCAKAQTTTPAPHPAPAQAAAQPAQPGPDSIADAPKAGPQPADAAPAAILPTVSKHDLKEAERDFRRGRKLFDKGDLEGAEAEYVAAADLSPGNTVYVEERELTQAKLVNQLVKRAAAARVSGDRTVASDLLARAHELDPQNSLVDEQIQAEATAEEPAVLPSAGLAHIEMGTIDLQPSAGKQALNVRGGAQELVRQAFQKFGITPTIDPSTPNTTVRVDTEPLDFAETMRVVQLLTGTFYVPLDPHRALVAKDTRENRDKFERQYVETVYMPGLTSSELQDASNIAKQVVNITKAATNTSNGTMTLRAPRESLDTVNALLADLYEGHSQVLLKLTLYQVTQTKERVVGVQIPSQLTLFNVPAELATLYSQYSSEIAQLIASGLVNANNPLEILAALAATGQLQNSPFTQGFVKFGGGLTEFAGQIGSGATGNLALNSTSARQLDEVQLRVQNHETATFRLGSRYPIITASYSNIGISTAALGTAGTNIMQLLNQAGLANSLTTATTPNIQYEDLGLTVKATPVIQRTGDISLKLEMQLSALGGGSLNGVPILNNREFQTVIGVKEGEASILTSNLSRQETKSLTGIPGLSDIPGFPATNVDHTVDTSQLVLVLEPHVVRLEHPGGAGKMIILPPHEATGRS